MWCGLFWRIFPRPISAFNCCSKTEHQQVRVAPHPRILKLWQARLRGCTVEILTDNQVSVYAQNNQWSSDHFMQYCLREIWLLLALKNIHLVARHICRQTNVLADSLSYHLADTYAAYVEHAATSLDLRQVFPDDSMFAFTAY